MGYYSNLHHNYLNSSTHTWQILADLLDAGDLNWPMDLEQDDAYLVKCTIT